MGSPSGPWYQGVGPPQARHSLDDESGPEDWSMDQSEEEVHQAEDSSPPAQAGEAREAQGNAESQLQLLLDTCEEISLGCGSPCQADLQLAHCRLLGIALAALELAKGGSTDLAAIAAWKASALELQQLLQEEAARSRREASAKSSTSWLEWADLAMQRGGGKMHKHCATQLPWKPFAVLQSDGVVTADPAAQLRHLVEELRPFWKPTWTTPSFRCQVRQSLGHVTADQVLKAAMTFKKSTAAALDGFHPRQYGLLSSGGRQVIGNILEACE